MVKKKKVKTIKTLKDIQNSKSSKSKNFTSSTPLPMEARYFHTSCCNANFKGIIISGRPFVICEKCNKKIGIIEKGQPHSLTMNLKEKHPKFTDIYNGEYLMVWKDERDCFFFQTPNLTLHFTRDEWKDFRKDLTAFNDL